MVLSDFLVPCGLLLGTVFVSFLLMCWFFHATYIKGLQRRVKRLEYMIASPKRTTEEVIPMTGNTPRPRPSRYVTIDRQPKSEHYH